MNDDFLTRLRKPPRPEFAASLYKRISRRENAQDAGSRIRLVRVVASGLLLVGVLLFTNPRVQALAQEILRFFFPAESSSFVLPQRGSASATATSSSWVTAAPEGCEDALTPLGYLCSIAGAEGAVAFDIRELPADPGGLEFGAAYVDPIEDVVRLSYSCSGCELTITQAHNASAIAIWDSAWSEVPSGAVEQVQVNGLAGEYVQGSFVSQDGNVAYWEADAARQRLRWREGDMLFEIDLGGRTESVEYLDKTGLIALAESMQ